MGLNEAPQDGLLLVADAFRHIASCRNFIASTKLKGNFRKVLFSLIRKKRRKIPEEKEKVSKGRCIVGLTKEKGTTV